MKRPAGKPVEWKPGDLYQSCGGHPVLCTEADEGDTHGGLYGISLVDGSFGHGCSKSACDPQRLTLTQALKLRDKIQLARARRDLDVLVGVQEIAKRLGASKQMVVNWKARYTSFPAPVAELSMGPVWRWEAIVQWHRVQKASLK